MLILFVSILFLSLPFIWLFYWKKEAHETLGAPRKKSKIMQIQNMLGCPTQSYIHCQSVLLEKNLLSPLVTPQPTYSQNQIHNLSDRTFHHPLFHPSAHLYTEPDSIPIRKNLLSSLVTPQPTYALNLIQYFTMG